MRGVFLGSGAVQLVHLPRVISDEFNITESEALRLLAAGDVSLDDEVVYLRSIPVDDLVGKQLRIGKESVEVSE